MPIESLFEKYSSAETYKMGRAYVSVNSDTSPTKINIFLPEGNSSLYVDSLTEDEVKTIAKSLEGDYLDVDLLKNIADKYNGKFCYSDEDIEVSEYYDYAMGYSEVCDGDEHIIRSEHLDFYADVTAEFGSMGLLPPDELRDTLIKLCSKGSSVLYVSLSDSDDSERLSISEYRGFICVESDNRTLCYKYEEGHEEEYVKKVLSDVLLKKSLEVEIFPQSPYMGSIRQIDFDDGNITLEAIGTGDLILSATDKGTVMTEKTRHSSKSFLIQGISPQDVVEALAQPNSADKWMKDTSDFFDEALENIKGRGLSYKQLSSKDKEKLLGSAKTEERECYD